MSSYMEYEGLLVLISMGTGILLVLAYELLAAFRRAVPHHPMVSSGEDFVYWAFTGLFLFSVLYRYNQGSIRFFFFFGSRSQRARSALPDRSLYQIFSVQHNSYFSPCTEIHPRLKT